MCFRFLFRFMNLKIRFMKKKSCKFLVTYVTIKVYPKNDYYSVFNLNFYDIKGSVSFIQSMKF